MRYPLRERERGRKDEVERVRKTETRLMSHDPANLSGDPIWYRLDNDLQFLHHASSPLENSTRDSHC